MEAIYVGPSGQVKMVTPIALSPGQVCRLADGRGAVYVGALNAAIGDLVVLETEGHFEVACASATTFSAFDVAVWDESASLAIATPGAEDDFVLGRVLRAKVDGELTVLVELNAQGASNGGGGAPQALRAVNLDHADATEHVVLDGDNNITGFAVPILRARVTEVMVGSSQDQLKVALYDEDDNKLGELTATDGAADTVGIVHFSGTCQNIPAGKGAYVKVSQATSGGTPAGAMEIQAFVVPLAA